MDTPTAFEAAKLIKKFLQQKAALGRGQVHAINRDLAGFFTAIPQADILKAVEALLGTLGKDGEGQWWTTFLSKKWQQTLRGKIHKPGGIHLSITMLRDIVLHSFKAALFTVGGRVFREAL